EREIGEGAGDAGDDFGVGEIGAVVRRSDGAAVAGDVEARRNAAGEKGVRKEAAFVAEAEAAEVFADDALDRFGRDAAGDVAPIAASAPCASPRVPSAAAPTVPSAAPNGCPVGGDDRRTFSSRSHSGWPVGVTELAYP